MLTRARKRAAQRQWACGLTFILLLTSAETSRVHHEIARTIAHVKAAAQVGTNASSEVAKTKRTGQLVLIGGLMCVLAITNTANAVVTQRRLAAARHVRTHLENVQSAIVHQRAAQCAQFRHTMLQMFTINIEMNTFVHINSALHPRDAEWTHIVETTTSTVKEMQRLLEEQTAFSCYSVDEGEVQLDKDTAKVQSRIDQLESKLYGDILRALMSFMLVAQNVKLERELDHQASEKDPSKTEGYDKLPSGVQDNIQAQFNSAIGQANATLALTEATFVAMQENARAAGLNSMTITIMFTLYSVLWGLIMVGVEIPIPAEVGLITSYLQIIKNGVILYVQLKDGGASRTDLMITELQLLQNVLASFQTTVVFSGGAIVPGVVQLIAVLSIVTSTISLLQGTLSVKKERKEYVEMLSRSEDVYIRFSVGASYKACNTLAMAERLAEVRESVVRAVPLEELEISGRLADEVVIDALGRSVTRLCKRAPRLCLDVLEHEKMPEVVVRAYGDERMTHLRELVARGPISDITVYTNEDQRIVMESFGFEIIYPGIMVCRACSRDLVVDLAVSTDRSKQDRCCCSMKVGGQCLPIPGKHATVFGHCPEMTLDGELIELHHQESGCKNIESTDFDSMRQRLADFDTPTHLKFVRLPDGRILGLYTQRDAQFPITELEHYLTERPSSQEYFGLHLSIADTLRSNDWQIVAEVQPPMRLRESSGAVFSGLIAKKGQISESYAAVQHPDETVLVSSRRIYDSIAITVGACRLDTAWREYATLLWDRNAVTLPPLSDPLASVDLWAVAAGFNAIPGPRWVNLNSWTSCVIQAVIPLEKPSDEVKVSSVHDILRGFHFPGESIMGWHTERWLRGSGVEGGQEAICCCSADDFDQCDWARNSCPDLEGPDGMSFPLVLARSEHCHARVSHSVTDWEEVSNHAHNLYGHRWRVERLYLMMKFELPDEAGPIHRQFALLTLRNELESYPTALTTSPEDTLGHYSPDITWDFFRNVGEARSPPRDSVIEEHATLSNLWDMAQNVIIGSLNFREASLQELNSPRCSFTDQSVGNALGQLLPDVISWDHNQAIPDIGHGMVITELRRDMEGVLWDDGECEHVQVSEALGVEQSRNVFSLPSSFQLYYTQKYAKSNMTFASFDNAVTSWAHWLELILSTEQDIFKVEGMFKQVATQIADCGCSFQATWHLPVNRNECPFMKLSSNGRRFSRVGVDVVNGATQEKCLSHQDALAVDSYVVQWSGGVQDGYGLAGSVLQQAGYVLLDQQRDQIADIKYGISQKVYVRYDPRVASTEHTKVSIRSTLDKVKEQRAYHEAHLARRLQRVA